mmetsp:Transcript_28954/g.71482  ORF Transcript_28954/g.71482 Transcript_28954/m.71482 type:complete len:271 (+) Transcript_28954:269-1081(+)
MVLQLTISRARPPRTREAPTLSCAMPATHSKPSKPARNPYEVQEAALTLNGFVVPKHTLEDVPKDVQMLFELTDAFDDELLDAKADAPGPKTHGSGREYFCSSKLKERAVRLAFSLYKNNGNAFKKGWATKVELDTGVSRQTVARWLRGHNEVEACVAAVLSFARVCDGDRESMTCFVSGGVFSTLQVLHALAKNLNVTPQHRYLLLLDDHGSRLEPAVVDAEARLRDPPSARGPHPPPAAIRPNLSGDAAGAVRAPRDQTVQELRHDQY